MFIKLINAQYPPNSVVWIETEHIVSILPEADGAGVLTVPGVYYKVQQTPNEVLAKIHPAYREREEY